MPGNEANQQKTIDELIMDILEDEAQIIRCLRMFFCKTLEELSKGYLTLDKKVCLASDLICTAAQKEDALAAVLEAISKIIEEEPVEWITLVPGASYQVTSQSPTISAITFIAKTDPGVTDGTISAIYNGSEQEVSGITDTPDHYTFNLGAPYEPSAVTLQNTGTVTVYIKNVIAS